MSFTTSSVPTVKAAVVSGLTSALPNTQVAYGYPGDVVERECVFIGDITGTMGIPTMKAGRKYRDEDYTITVTIDVIKVAGTVQEADSAAFTILAALENLLANDPGFTGATAAVAGTFSTDAGQTDEGSFCRLTVTINVTNRLL